MIKFDLNYKRLKINYLKFLKSQEALSEPFRDKLEQLNKFYIPISEVISKYKKNNNTTIIGLSGGQGSGKSTISNVIKIILKEKFKLNTAIFSIDDYYKTSAEREKMSTKVSSLFKTRGVPGTHDTKLLYSTLKNLKKKKFKKMNILKFDKSIDDRLPKNKWQTINKKPDIVIFEGWCVGATPQINKDLLVPINRLEKEYDKKRIWRKKVNKELKNDYKRIFKFIDYLIFLKVPSFFYVLEWRLLQEKKLKKKTSGKKVMSAKEVKKFVMFYERLTKHMLKTLDKKANCVVDIDRKHRLKSIKFN